MCVGTCMYSMVIGFCCIIHSAFVRIPGENVAIASVPDIDLTCEECICQTEYSHQLWESQH